MRFLTLSLAAVLIFAPFHLFAGSNQNVVHSVMRSDARSRTFQPLDSMPLVLRERGKTVTAINGAPSHIELVDTGLPVKRIDLPQELVQVDELHLVEQKSLVVIGMVNGSVSQVVILDTTDLSIRDSFWCYRPTLSPNGKAIAFVKFYPPHFVDGTEDHYMLYSLDRSPGNNRPAGIPPKDQQTVGTTVFPEVMNAESNNVRKGDQTHVSASTGFFWSKDSNKFVFADRYGESLKIVTVFLQRGHKSKLLVTPLNLENICGGNKSTGCYPRVTAVDWEDKRMVVQVGGLGVQGIKPIKVNLSNSK